VRIKLFGRVFYMPSWVKFAVVILIFIVLAFIGYNIRKEKNILSENPDLLATTASPQPTESTVLPSPIQTVPQNDTLTIYIIGCVANPSVVTVPFGSIVQDAVDAAGGLTEEADPTRINMAYPLSDNMMIKIPSSEDTEENFTFFYDEWIVTAPPQKTAGANIESSSQHVDYKININTADKKTLCNLPGIGESTAQKIIDFRKENGPFEYIEDIMKIPGIKQSRFDSIKDMITV